ncbi:MAG: HEAT repeat domain-containing protein [Deltaproteobacteria bacterium]
MIPLLALALFFSVAPAPARPCLTDDQLSLLEDRLARGGSFKVRLQAALILGAGGRVEAEAPLKESLRGDPQPQVRAATALALAELGGGEVASALVEALGDEDRFVRAEAVRALSQLAERLGPALAQPLGAALGGAPSGPRAAGIPVLALLGAEGAQQLASLPGDDAPEVRAAVREALGRLPAEVANSALRYALKAGSFSARAAAATALAERGDVASLSALADAASAPTEVPEVQAAAFAALRALSGLIDPDVERARLAQSPMPPERIRALVLLSVREGPKAEHACEQALRDPSPLVQAYAVETLGRLSDPRALPELRRMLDREEDAPLHGVLAAAIHSIERAAGATAR